MTEREAGIYAGIPNDEYHRGPGISKSGLDLIARSPMHYRFATDAANDNSCEPTPSQRLGSLVHKLVLEPFSFGDEYVVGPKFDRRTKEGKAFAEAFEAGAAGRIVIGQDEADLGAQIRDAVFAHPFAAALLGGQGDAELSAYWRDAETGVLCRCRPDYWRRDGILVDVKTTTDASPEAFARSVLDWRYHVQAAFYLEGTGLAIGQAETVSDLALPHEFVFIAVETKPPHAVACYRLDRETLSIGAREFRRNLDTFAECQRSGVWPAFGGGLQPLGLPEWYLARAAREAALQQVTA